MRPNTQNIIHQPRLIREWNQITKNNNKLTISKPRPPPPTRPEHKRTFANKCADLLFKYKYNNKLEVLIDLLNMITDYDLESTTLDKFTIGECVQY